MVLSGVCVIAVLACNAQTRKDTGPVLQTSATSTDITYKPKQEDGTSATTAITPAKEENKAATAKSNSKKTAKAQKKNKAATAKADNNAKQVKTRGTAQEKRETSTGVTAKASAQQKQTAVKKKNANNKKKQTANAQKKQTTGNKKKQAANAKKKQTAAAKKKKATVNKKATVRKKEPKETSGERYIALKTNVPFLAVAVANLGLEVQVHKHVTIDFPVMWSISDIEREHAIRGIAFQPEGRWWLGETGTGHFFGLHTHLAWFNLKWNDHRYQTLKRPLTGVGLSYGYKMTWGEHWGAEFNIGAGYANVKYNTYYNIENGAPLGTRIRHYWGITRAGISLVYRF